MRGGKDEDNSDENLSNTGDGEWRYCHCNAVTPHALDTILSTK